MDHNHRYYHRDLHQIIQDYLPNGTEFSWLMDDDNDDDISGNTEINKKTCCLKLYLITIGACCFISFSSMLALFLFSNLIKYNNNNNNNQKSIPKGNRNKKSPPELYDPNKNPHLKLVLAFAVGSLIADVFLHILPEASVELSKAGYSTQRLQHFLGIWILIGLILFATIETFTQQLILTEKNDFFDGNHSADPSSSSSVKKLSKKSKNEKITIPTVSIESNRNSTTTGYLNLLANGFDNFTHGMSVAASFSISFKMGILTTLAIAIHEIPHEMVDFIILIRSGFSCIRAFRAQLYVSMITIIGNITVLYFDTKRSDSTMSYTLWILPLTSGGFIYIALSSLLPELLSIDDDQYDDHNDDDDDDRRTPVAAGKRRRHLQIIFQRMLFVVLGVLVMEAVNRINV